MTSKNEIPDQNFKKPNSRDEENPKKPNSRIDDAHEAELDLLEKRNSIRNFIQSFGGAPKLVGALVRYGLKLDPRTPNLWTKQGFIPVKYKAAIHKLNRDNEFVLDDPETFLKTVFRVPTFARNTDKPTYFANPELATWVRENGGVQGIANRMTPASEYRSYSYTNVFNWLKRGRVPVFLRETLVEWGCPKEILDAPLINEDGTPKVAGRKAGRPRAGAHVHTPNFRMKTEAKIKAAQMQAEAKHAKPKTELTEEDLLG